MAFGSDGLTVEGGGGSGRFSGSDIGGTAGDCVLAAPRLPEGPAPHHRNTSAANTDHTVAQGIEMRTERHL